MIVSIDVAPAEPNSLRVAEREIIEDDPAKRGCLGFGREADDGLEDPEIVHQLHQRDEDDQRHHVGNDDIADLLPAGGTVDAGGLQRIGRHGLKPGIEDDEGEKGVECQIP